ncbi:sigma factor-like helix-turn-helix DNA-binding protein [Streptomyces sp. NBC_01262]|uniref:sigma factor-like helix-turn-helix DNA-binding protein n=1 Tax=Streptomyces sp. NBC_01262 TaxID=2903803 RepID=UPI002E35D689|nr:sigma factor-like helix-turn-helix DNA-binding protein [Streptomyces sp. NBC_01262]
MPARPGDVAGLPTRDLLEVVVACGYAGHAWDELTRRLAGKALPDLEWSIRTGTIFARCRRAGVGICPRWELQRPPLSQDIAAEAVEQCLERFKDRVLPAGEWDPEQGTDLEDFFTVCCLPDLANRWRWHLRQFPPSAVELDAFNELEQAGVLAQALEPPPDPADVVELRDEVSRLSAAMGPGDRTAFALADEGWTPVEIAQVLGISRSTLDTRMSRARKAARTRRTQ